MISVKRLLEGMADRMAAWLTERAIMFPLQNRCVNAGGMVIHGAGSAVPKTVNSLLFLFDSFPVLFAAADTAAIPAAPVIPTANSAICVFTLDINGNKGAMLSNPAATVGQIDVPSVPKGLIPYGMVLIQNATGSNFTGGTTALDTGSLTVNYFDIVGAIDFDNLPNN